MREHFSGTLFVSLHPYVYAYVTKGLFSSLARKWKKRFGVRVMENQSLGLLEMRFTDAKGQTLSPHEEKHDEKHDENHDDKAKDSVEA